MPRKSITVEFFFSFSVETERKQISRRIFVEDIFSGVAKVYRTPNEVRTDGSEFNSINSETKYVNNDTMGVCVCMCRWNVYAVVQCVASAIAGSAHILSDIRDEK